MTEFIIVAAIMLLVFVLSTLPVLLFTSRERRQQPPRDMDKEDTTPRHQQYSDIVPFSDDDYCTGPAGWSDDNEPTGPY